MGRNLILLNTDFNRVGPAKCPDVRVNLIFRVFIYPNQHPFGCHIPTNTFRLLPNLPLFLTIRFLKDQLFLSHSSGSLKGPPLWGCLRLPDETKHSTIFTHYTEFFLGMGSWFCCSHIPQTDLGLHGSLPPHLDSILSELERGSHSVWGSFLRALISIAYLHFK